MAWSSNLSDFGGPSNFRCLSAGSYSTAVDKTNVKQQETFDATSIAELFPGIPNVKVSGVIIAKGDRRQFFSKKDIGSERFVLGFTIRDSPTEFINVSCWGSDQYVGCLAATLHVGQTVEITNACIQPKPADGSDEKFRPTTPSMYQLSVNETRGVVHPCDEWIAADYNRLLHVPVKPHNDYYTIGDIFANGQDMSGDIVSLMAAVKQVGPVREMKAKNGRPLQKCEVRLFDDTAIDFVLILWDEELISLAKTWDPKENVIFAADVRVTFDEYKKTMVATAIAKTVITVNPDTTEAHNLYQYAQTVNLADITSADAGGGSAAFEQNIDLKQIDKVYTVSELASKMAAGQSNPSDPVRGITYAFISSLDIDGPSTFILSRRCSTCHYRLPANSEECVTCRGQSAQGIPPPGGAAAPEMTFDVRVAVSDHTGTVSNCILAGPIAEKTFGIRVDDFLKLDEQRKTELKWLFLLEKCKVYFQLVFPAAGRKGRPSMRILQCSQADVDEAVRSI